MHRLAPLFAIGLTLAPAAHAVTWPVTAEATVCYPIPLVPCLDSAMQAYADGSVVTPWGPATWAYDPASSRVTMTGVGFTAEGTRSGLCASGTFTVIGGVGGTWSACALL